MLKSIGSLKGRISTKQHLRGSLNNAVVKQYPELEDITITPTGNEQNFKSNKYGYDNVTVEAISAEELTIIPKEEIQDFDGVYKKVIVEPIATEQATIDLDFKNKESIQIIPAEGKYLSEVKISKDNNLVADNIRQGTVIEGIEGTMAGAWDSSQIRQTKYMFYNNSTMTEAPFIDTSNVTSVESMFSNCTKLIRLPNYNFENVTNMSSTFFNCTSLNYVPALNTAKVTTFTTCFKYAQIFETPKWNFESAKNLQECFSYCNKLVKANYINSFENTSLRYCFRNCDLLEEVEGIETGNVYDMTNAFFACYALKTIPEMNTSKVTTWQYTFSNCRTITNIPSLDFSAGTIMIQCFRGCSSLVDVPVLSFVSANNLGAMFQDCPKLSDESLNNIMQSIVNGTKVTSTSYKTLKYIGLSATQASRCQALQAYSAFIASGWTTGY